MGFDVAAEAYDRFMGRYSRLLAPQIVDLAGIRPGQRVLDVGCGPGALLGELAERLGSDGVVGADPSASFVEAARVRHPGVEVVAASAEALPFDDAAFDAALAQLVVHFMADPVAGLTEMRRVTRPGGVVVASVWDLGGGQSPLSHFWSVAGELDRDVEDESRRPGARQGHLVELFGEAGLADVEEAVLTIGVEHPSFDEWWEPYTGGVGPAGAYVMALDAGRREELRRRLHDRLGDGPFHLTSRAWAARGRVPG